MFSLKYAQGTTGLALEASPVTKDSFLKKNCSERWNVVPECHKWDRARAVPLVLCTILSKVQRSTLIHIPPSNFYQLPISFYHIITVSESFAVSDCFLLNSIVLWKSIPYVAMRRRLMRELKELRTSPPEGIRVQLSEESVLDVVGIVEGPGASRWVEFLGTGQS